MTIQINTDKNIEAEERHQDYFSSQLAASFERYEDHLTRVEVHLKDENGKKNGVKDKTCTLEARLKGKQPIAVTANEDSIQKALASATDKAISAISKVIDKSQSHKR